MTEKNKRVRAKTIRYERDYPKDPVEPVTLFACPICGVRYPRVEDADRCRDRGRVRLASEIAVGDIVLAARARFGWYDGDPAWIAEDWEGGKGMGLRGEGGLSFYYVVIAIADSYPHRAGGPDDPHDDGPVLCLATAAMSGEKGYRGGWTGAGHVGVEKVSRPPKLPGIDEILAIDPLSLRGLL